MGFPGVILLFIHPGFVYKDEGNCRLGAGPGWVLSMGVLQSEGHGKLHGRAGCFFWGTMTKRTPPIGNQHNTKLLMVIKFIFVHDDWMIWGTPPNRKST